MGRPASSGSREDELAIKALNQRVEAILTARPAYREIVDFYRTVFVRQLEWRGRLTVRPEDISRDQASACLRAGAPLADRFDPGIDPASLADLWTEMKAVFRRGNDVLRRAVATIDHAEQADGFVPGPWLSEQRPDRTGLVADAARRLGVDEGMLGSLSRAVTLPHWEQVAQRWLPSRRLDEWKRFRCPTCGGLPGLAELRADQGTGDGVKAATWRYMHCSFCGSRWAVAALTCPACGSVKSGDAKYLFTADEPEWRIDFCRSCHHYVKVIDGDKIHGRVHVGLELLTSAHLDMLARDKNLTPLEVCA